MITFEEYENALKQRHGERIHNILSHSSVAIAGLGGLGSNIAMYLARAGVGHLHLVDFDKVDITNLNRQQYDIADLGTLKTDALTKNIKRFNPFIEITSQCVKVNDRFYLCGDAESDMNDGLALAAPRVAICAAHEANMILRLLIGEKEV